MAVCRNNDTINRIVGVVVDWTNFNEINYTAAG